jgi:catalase
MADEKPPVTTTDAGIPAASDEHSLTAGPDGPILLQDHYLIQKMAQSNTGARSMQISARESAPQSKEITPPVKATAP